jgi:hypothetical protein
MNVDLEINNIKVWRTPTTSGWVHSTWWDLSPIYDKASQCTSGTPGIAVKKGWDQIKSDLKLIATRKKPTGMLLGIDFFYQVNATSNIFNLPILKRVNATPTTLTTQDLVAKLGGNIDARNIVKDALLHTGANCRLYQQTICSLLNLSARPLNRIVVYGLKTRSTNPKLDTTESLGWDANSARVKAYIVGGPRIYIHLPILHYVNGRNRLTEADFVTILSGLLFEIGNLVEHTEIARAAQRLAKKNGNTSEEARQKEKVCKRETRVTLDNALRVLRIALQGGVLAQQDWRNLMAVVIGMQFNVNNGQYSFQRALEFFKKTPHNLGDRTLSQISKKTYQ